MELGLKVSSGGLLKRRTACLGTAFFWPSLDSGVMGAEYFSACFHSPSFLQPRT